MSIEWSDIEANLLTALNTVYYEALDMRHGIGWGSPLGDKFRIDAKRRYEEGRAEHADTFESWDYWTQERFAFEMREELIDAVLYAAAKETTRAESR